MAGSRASYPIEAFFVNPAFDFDFDFQQQRQQPNMAHNNNPSCGAADHFTDYWFPSHRTMPSTGKAPATITNLVHNSMLLHGYTSEEEIASPIDDDSCSLHSDESVIGELTFPEALAESCNKVEQQCNRAQAVKIQSAGKAKVVSLPKLVDIPSRRGVVRPASIQPHRKSSPRRDSTQQAQSARSSQDSHYTSCNSSAGNSSATHSPVSTAPSSGIIEQSVEVKRRSSVVSRHVPLFEAARAISPTTPTQPWTPSSFLEPRSLGLTKRENTASSHRSNSSTSPLKLPLKRMNKLSSNFSLNRIGKEFRDTFVPRDAARGSYLEDVKEPESVMVTPHAPHPPRISSVSKPKMVARAANERAPTIELPPFPDEQDGFSSDWSLEFGGTTSTFAEMRSSNRVAPVA